MRWKLEQTLGLWNDTMTEVWTGRIVQEDGVLVTDLTAQLSVDRDFAKRFAEQVTERHNAKEGEKREFPEVFAMLYADDNGNYLVMPKRLEAAFRQVALITGRQ